jgi:HEAT repeat protein
MTRTVCILAMFLATLGVLGGCGKSEEELKKEQAVVLLGQLTDADPAAQKSQVEKLVALGKPAVAPLTEALPKSAGGKELTIIHVLGQIKDVGALEPLTQEWKTGPAEVRQGVVTALGVIASIDGLRTLSDAAEDDPAAAVRAAAATSLGQLNNPRVLPVLLRVLRDESEKVHQAAIAALGSLGQPALNPLLEARQSEEEAVRTGAWLALEQLAHKFKADLTSQDVEVRVTAVESLGRIGNPAHAKALTLLLMDKEERVRLAAARSLERLQNPATKVLLRQAMQRPEETAPVRLAATIALGKMGDEGALQKLVADLDDPDDAVRVSAAIALGESGTAAAPLLRTALKSGPPPVRAGAARALGALGDEQSVPDLLAALQDSEPYVRATAALSLGEIGSEEAVEPLLGLLDDADPVVAWCAAWAVEETGETALQPLVQAAQERLSPEEARLLGRIGGPAGREVLVAALHDPQQKAVHPEVVWSLGQIGARRNALPLLRALNSSEEATRQAAAAALARMNRLTAGKTLRRGAEPPGLELTRRAVRSLRRRSAADESAAVRQAAGLAVVQVDPEGGDLVDQWLVLLETRDPALRAAAARALGARGDLRAIPSLEKALTDPDPQVQEAARKALHAITGLAPQTAAGQL